MQHKVAAAEGIRGIACFMVVLSHLSLSFFPYLHAFDQSRMPAHALELWIHHSPFAFFYSGTAAVYIFFVLSGYVLSYALMARGDTLYKLKSMCFKRYPRLMLPALGSCLLLWLAFTTLQPDGRLLNEWIDVFGNHAGTFGDALYDGSIRTFWNGYSEYNWALWTMKIELVGSLIIFALVYALHRGWSLWWMTPLAVVVSYALIRLVPFNIDNLLPLNALDMFENSLEILSFLFGMLFYCYASKIGFKLALIFLLIGLYFAGVHDDSLSYQWLTPWFNDRAYNFLCFLSGPFIVGSILMNEQLSAFFSTRIPVFLGKISFAAYLNHLLIIYVVGIPFFNLLHQLQVNHTLDALLSCGLVLLIIVLFSERYYRWVDQPTMRLTNKLANFYLKKS